MTWTNQRTREKVNRLRAIAGHEVARIGDLGSQRRSVTWPSGLTERSRRSGREDVTARLLSVNVGLPRDIAWRGRTVRSAVWKTPVEGRRIARWLNIDGDGQGDLAGHGGEHRAVFVYQIDSYRYWQDRLGRNDFAYGQFGENFTIDGLSV